MVDEESESDSGSSDASGPRQRRCAAKSVSYREDSEDSEASGYAQKSKRKRGSGKHMYSTDEDSEFEVLPRKRRSSKYEEDSDFTVSGDSDAPRKTRLKKKPWESDDDEPVVKGNRRQKKQESSEEESEETEEEEQDVSKKKKNVLRSDSDEETENEDEETETEDVPDRTAKTVSDKVCTDSDKAQVNGHNDSKDTSVSKKAVQNGDVGDTVGDELENVDLDGVEDIVDFVIQDLWSPCSSPRRGNKGGGEGECLDTPGSQHTAAPDAMMALQTDFMDSLPPAPQGIIPSRPCPLTSLAGQPVGSEDIVFPGPSQGSLQPQQSAAAMAGVAYPQAAPSYPSITPAYPVAAGNTCEPTPTTSGDQYQHSVSAGYPQQQGTTAYPSVATIRIRYYRVGSDIEASIAPTEERSEVLVCNPEAYLQDESAEEPMDESNDHLSSETTSDAQTGQLREGSAHTAITEPIEDAYDHLPTETTGGAQPGQFNEGIIQNENTAITEPMEEANDHLSSDTTDDAQPGEPNGGLIIKSTHATFTMEESGDHLSSETTDVTQPNEGLVIKNTQAAFNEGCLRVLDKKPSNILVDYADGSSLAPPVQNGPSSLVSVVSPNAIEMDVKSEDDEPAQNFCVSDEDASEDVEIINAVAIANHIVSEMRAMSQTSDSDSDDCVCVSVSKSAVCNGPSPGGNELDDVDMCGIENIVNGVIKDLWQKVLVVLQLISI